MPIPWLIGIAAVATVTAIRNNAKKNREQEEYDAYNRAQDKAEEDNRRVQEQAKKDAQTRAAAEQVRDQKAQENKRLSLAEQKADKIINKYSLKDLDKLKVATLAINNSNALEKTLKESYEKTESYLNVKNNIMKSENDLHEIQQLLKIIKEIKA
jgi:hypothetical protein